MGNWKNHIGSTLAIIAGIGYFLSGLQNPQAPNAGIIIGPLMVVGALAYRSAKVRKLNPAKNTTLRLVLELAAMILILVLWLGQSDLKDRIAIDPFPNLIIPLWAVVAYAIMFFRKPKIATA